MPFDLNAVERGYGECPCDWSGSQILLRYRADLNNRALIAMKRAVVGVEVLGGGGRFPDVEAIIDELLRVLLPGGPEVPAEERGWDLTDNGAPVPITFDTLVDLPPGLPAKILGTIFRDVNDPDRRRPSRPSSSRGAGSAQIVSPITGLSSVTPAGSVYHPGPSPASLTLAASGSVGANGSA